MKKERETKNDELIKVINPSEQLSQDEMVNILGGMNDADAFEKDCTCDCWFDNSNKSK